MTVRQLQCVTLTCNGKQASGRANIGNLSLLQITDHAMHDDLYKFCECAQPLSRTTVLQLGHRNKKCAMKVCSNTVPNYALFVSWIPKRPSKWTGQRVHIRTCHFPETMSCIISASTPASFARLVSLLPSFFFCHSFTNYSYSSSRFLRFAVTRFVHIYIGAYRCIGTMLPIRAVHLQAEPPPKYAGAFPRPLTSGIS